MTMVDDSASFVGIEGITDAMFLLEVHNPPFQRKIHDFHWQSSVVIIS